MSSLIWVRFFLCSLFSVIVVLFLLQWFYQITFLVAHLNDMLLLLCPWTINDSNFLCINKNSEINLGFCNLKSQNSWIQIRIFKWKESKAKYKVFALLDENPLAFSMFGKQFIAWKYQHTSHWPKTTLFPFQRGKLQHR